MHDFVWVLKQIEEGKKVARFNWNGAFLSDKGLTNTTNVLCHEFINILTIRDILADDWILVLDK